MKAFLTRTLFLVVFLATLAGAQDVIPLYPAMPPGSAQENYPEKEYFSKIWNTEVVANVTKPSLTVFKPSPELRKRHRHGDLPGRRIYGPLHHQRGHRCCQVHGRERGDGVCAEYPAAIRQRLRGEQCCIEAFHAAWPLNDDRRY